MKMWTKSQSTNMQQRSLKHASDAKSIPTSEGLAWKKLKMLSL